MTMDGISVPSRFSCLKIEDEEFRPVSNKANQKKKQESTKQVKKNNSITIKKPTKQSQSSGVSSKKKNKGKLEEKQWEDWKKKDGEYVDENFEQDLQSAILQSKLDFEHRKKNSVSVNDIQDKLKRKKNKTMSLDEFLDSGNQSSNKDKDTEIDRNDKNFFEKVINSTKEEIRREKVEEQRRERANNIDEVISLAHCQEKLQKEKELNDELRRELEESRKEISLVKKRNKTLCNMLSQGEMKDKAAVLLELEKLTTVKEELTEEVARLHKLLEQERSSTKAVSNSVSESHNPKQKIKKKKN
ncbi:hypothetical protein JTB14_004817 [Gonioctena quinquepunctata]|nr:hypothetical protein JTB14_004817 [Gonioctena quinquepunctata]